MRHVRHLLLVAGCLSGALAGDDNNNRFSLGALRRAAKQIFLRSEDPVEEKVIRVPNLRLSPESGLDASYTIGSESAFGKNVLPIDDSEEAGKVFLTDRAATSKEIDPADKSNQGEKNNVSEFDAFLRLKKHESKKLIAQITESIILGVHPRDYFTLLQRALELKKGDEQKLFYASVIVMIYLPTTVASLLKGQTKAPSYVSFPAFYYFFKPYLKRLVKREQFRDERKLLDGIKDAEKLEKRGIQTIDRKRVAKKRVVSYAHELFLQYLDFFFSAAQLKLVEPCTSNDIEQLTKYMIKTEDPSRQVANVKVVLKALKGFSYWRAFSAVHLALYGGATKFGNDDVDDYLIDAGFIENYNSDMGREARDELSDDDAARKNDQITNLMRSIEYKEEPEKNCGRHTPAILQFTLGMFHGLEMHITSPIAHYPDESPECLADVVESLIENWTRDEKYDRFPKLIWREKTLHKSLPLVLELWETMPAANDHEVEGRRAFLKTMRILSCSKDDIWPQDTREIRLFAKQAYGCGFLRVVRKKEMKEDTRAIVQEAVHYQNMVILQKALSKKSLENWFKGKYDTPAIDGVRKDEAGRDISAAFNVYILSTIENDIRDTKSLYEISAREYLQPTAVLTRMVIPSLTVANLLPLRSAHYLMRGRLDHLPEPFPQVAVDRLEQKALPQYPTDYHIHKPLPPPPPNDLLTPTSQKSASLQISDGFTSDASSSRRSSYTSSEGRSSQSRDDAYYDRSGQLKPQNSRLRISLLILDIIAQSHPREKTNPLAKMRDSSYRN